MHLGSPYLAVALAALIAAPVEAQGARWRVLPGPAAHSTKQLCFDSGRGRVVMVESSGEENVFRTWERVGDEWSLRHTPTTPPPRDRFAAGYDPVRQRVVLFGGITNTVVVATAIGDTWEYDGTTWTPSVLPNGPPAQSDAVLAFDHANGKLLLFGGMTSSWNNGGSWLYDGASWTQLAPSPFSAGYPTSYFAIATDPSRSVVV